MPTATLDPPPLRSQTGGFTQLTETRKIHIVLSNIPPALVPRPLPQHNPGNGRGKLHEIYSGEAIAFESMLLKLEEIDFAITSIRVRDTQTASLHITFTRTQKESAINQLAREVVEEIIDGYLFNICMKAIKNNTFQLWCLEKHFYTRLEAVPESIIRFSSHRLYT